MRAPGPDHPITISRNTNRVVVRSGDRVVADTRKALMLRESSYPAVQYVPRDDADMTQLRRSDHVTVRPYKGQAAYFNLPVLEARGRNAVWTFEAPLSGGGRDRRTPRLLSRPGHHQRRSVTTGRTAAITKIGGPASSAGS